MTASTKGYKESRFKAFDTKREAQDWLKSECNNSTDEAIESAGMRKTRPGPSKKGEHCKMDLSLMVRMRRKVI